MRNLLRLEGACYAIAALLIYWQQGFSWWFFAILILVPDLSMLGFLAGPRIGAICYNIVHSTIGPWALLFYCYWRPTDLILSIVLIWFIHIGVDRALGYGLKYPDDFKHTHLSEPAKA